MGRSFRHWTPRYVVDRLGVMAHARLNPDAPWLTSQAVRALDDWLRQDDQGIEWGSGRSTIWLARRVRRLVSIEHDPQWYETIQARLLGTGLNNVEYHLAEIGNPEEAPEDHPYVAIAGQQPVSSIDFALVDGVLRDRCAALAIKLLRPGGLLVIDNSNWFLPHASRSPKSVGETGRPPSSEWNEVARLLVQWRSLWTSNGVTDTAFFIKPAAVTEERPR